MTGNAVIAYNAKNLSDKKIYNPTSTKAGTKLFVEFMILDTDDYKVALAASLLLLMRRCEFIANCNILDSIPNTLSKMLSVVNIYQCEGVEIEYSKSKKGTDESYIVYSEYMIRLLKDDSICITQDNVIEEIMTDMPKMEHMRNYNIGTFGYKYKDRSNSKTVPLVFIEDDGIQITEVRHPDVAKASALELIKEKKEAKTIKGGYKLDLYLLLCIVLIVVIVVYAVKMIYAIVSCKCVQIWQK